MTGAILEAGDAVVSQRELMEPVGGLKTLNKLIINVLKIVIIYEGKELLKEATFPGRDRGTCKGPQENVLGLVRSRGKGTWAKVEKAVSREWREGPSQACLVCRIWS